MTGFGRALRAEFWALRRRRGTQWALFLVLAVGFFQPLLRALMLAGGEPQVLDSLATTHQNFWPRFGQGAGFGLALAELSALVLIAGAMPREVAQGALRDPMARRISRPAFATARALLAGLLPLVLGLAAVVGSAVGSALAFDAGHIVTAPVVLGEENPRARSAFQDWLAESGLSADQAAAELERDPDWAIPAEHYPFVPVLVAFEEDVRAEVLQGLWSGVPALVALGLVAFALSVFFSSGALAGGAGLGLVLFSGTFSDSVGDWVFANALPGLGSRSALDMATQVADGYTDIPPVDPDAAIRALVAASLAALVGVVLSLLAFRRRAL